MIDNVREMLLVMGTPPYLAEMSIPYVWFTPGTIDPDSQPVMQLIEALQRGIKRLGYPGVKVNGVMDRQTAQALDRISGPEWKSKAFIQLMGDVIAAVRNPGRATDRAAWRKARKMVGAKIGLHGYMDLGETTDSGGMSLTFGRGIRNPANMVPIDGMTRGVFEELQREINRIGGSVAVDGIIGEDTLRGYEKALKPIQLSWSEPLVFLLKRVNTTTNLAGNAYSIMMGLKTLAARPPVHHSKPPAKKDSPKEPMTPSQYRRSELFSRWGKWAAVAALGGVGVWYGMKQGDK